MKKEIIKCDMCGNEIVEKHIFSYRLSRRFEFSMGTSSLLPGPDELDICRFCVQELLEKYGKWPEALKPPVEAIEDEPSYHDGVGPDK